METKEEYLFEKWFDGYFCNQQGEDSPYRYIDIEEAWKEATKQERQKAERLINEFEDYVCGLKIRKVKGRHQLISIQDVLALIHRFKEKMEGDL